MPRSKKTVALEGLSESGAPQPEIKTNEIHRSPVIIASLLLMRGLLPRDVFGERILRANRFHERYDYSQFVNGKGKGNFARNRSEYVPIWVIERHMSDEADQLLDLLENGIFDALLRGVLHAVQFTIIANKESPNKVLESYTFTFDNFGERGTADRLTNGPRMDFVSPHEDRANMRNRIFEGKSLIRRLSKMCAESPALPNERSLGIHVFYKPECPGSYDMHGFSDSQDDTIEYPRTSYWERRRFYGKVDSGFHTRVGLRVNSLISTSPGGEAHFPLAEEAKDDAVHRSDEVGIPTPAQMPLDVAGDIYVSTDESTDDAISSSEEFPGLQYSPIVAKMITTEKKVDDRIFFKEEDVESRQSRMHKMAQAAAKSVEVGEDDSSETNFVREADITQPRRRSRIPFNWSQEDVYTTFPISHDGYHLSKARRESRVNFFPAKYIRRLQEAGSKPTVAARTVEYVENRHSALKELDEKNKDNKESLTGQSGNMAKYGHADWRHYRCECNTWDFKPSKSIQCANCKDWQHTLCYDYYSAKDSRIPDIHYCYTCLIGYDFDSNLMEELIQVIRMRRTIQWVLEMGATPTLKLAAGQIIDHDEARATVHSIRKLGILKSGKWSKMKGYYTMGSSKFRLDNSILQYHIQRNLGPDVAYPGICHMSESAEWYNTIDPRWQPKLWERVRSNPSVNGYFFEGQTSNSVSKRLLDSADEGGFEDDILLTRDAEKIRLK
ncbi:Zinc finger, FYVE/PHD-type [Penicillium italicum]|uniref:Zinc finger, FYVE/PHD-type n=1 Tax=Penicillium italicum TaxID=40296 RepID=A0A0A2KZU9_PENIT|nr:Zinc finger, FYVE/PHD-type [Penicillium italicum]